SPDGARIAFLAHLPTHTEVWTADASTGRARSLSGARVAATLAAGDAGEAGDPSDMIQWTPEGTVISLLVPADRGPAPARNRVPSSPVVRRTRDEPMSTRTYPFLLEDEHDEDLFEHYTTSQIAELAPGEDPRPIGAPGMWESLSLSPDGRHLLATRLERPFSYRVYASSFPDRTVILDRESGSEVAVLVERSLREGGGFFGGGGPGARDFAWRPDGAGLSYLVRASGEDEAGEGGSEGERPDRVMLATAPFDLDDADVVAESADPLQDLVYSRDGVHAFAEASRNGESALVHFDLADDDPGRDVVVDFHSGDDLTALPGDLVTGTTANGLDFALVSSDGAAVYLEGPGYAEDLRPTPFLDRVSITDGTTTRLFEGSKEAWERPLLPLDPDLRRMIVSRESKTDFPDSFLWTRDGGIGPNLTNNVDPFPDVTAAERIDFGFTRRDGVEVRGRVSMPVGWEQGDGPVPAIFWTYPREYEEADEYAESTIRSRNLNEFAHMSWLRWSDIWLAAGYALVYPDIPIIGENYNDTYIASLVDAMYGAIRAVDSLGVVDVDRIGHGGHSYGAFATANILANAPYFKAGIAGDGAYNRSLTPNGFQAER
ncbi:MAG TPA: prolyl oligopeptidase family serine peptidase, partial [Longimicrobiales bacterium]|nr:prolyl oligopeptidase family serine peptidase [Longimicrobiales bacterium]